MERLIKARRLVSDNWRLLEPRTGEHEVEVPPRGAVIVPLAAWQRQRQALLARGAVGVRLDGNDKPEDIAADLSALPLIAVHYSNFRDSRGHAIARSLRQRFAYRGELRAIGDVLRDELYYLAHVGFDAFALRPDQNVDECLEAFGDFNKSYRPSISRPVVPLFRRAIV